MTIEIAAEPDTQNRRKENLVSSQNWRNLEDLDEPWKKNVEQFIIVRPRPLDTVCLK